MVADSSGVGVRVGADSRAKDGPELDARVAEVADRARAAGTARPASPVTTRRGFASRDCKGCGTSFTPTAPASLYCAPCQEARKPAKRGKLKAAPRPEPAKRGKLKAAPRPEPEHEGGGGVADAVESARARYLDLLLERAAQPDAPDELLDRIERLIGLAA